MDMGRIDNLVVFIGRYFSLPFFIDNNGAIKISGVAQWLAYQDHTLRVEGSIPSSATKQEVAQW